MCRKGLICPCSTVNGRDRDSSVLQQGVVFRMQFDHVHDLRIQRLQRQAFAGAAARNPHSAAAARPCRSWRRSRRRLGLGLERAPGGDAAFRAVRLAGDADMPAVQDQPVMRVRQELRAASPCSRRCSTASGVRAARQPGAIGDAEHMRIHRERGFAKCHVEHHVGRLAAHARQGFQCLAITRHLAAMAFDAAGDTFRSRSSPWRCTGQCGECRASDRATPSASMACGVRASGTGGACRC